MSGFANPIIGGGGALVYPAIHSPDYAAGSAGWTIRKDGSAEFNNLTSRGEFISEDGAFTIELTHGQMTVSYNGTEVFTLGAGGLGDVSLYSLGTGTSDNTGLTLLSDAALQGPAIWRQVGSLAATEFLIGPSGDTSGVTDAANINGALAGPAGFPSGGYPVRLTRGTYYVNATVTVPDNGRLLGAGRATIISAVAPFTGTTVLALAGSNYSEAGSLQVNANSLADGIQMQSASNPYIHDIDIEQPKNGVGTSGTTITIRAERITAHQASGIGFLPTGTDSTWIDCLALGCAAQGWLVGNGTANTKFIGCRAEFSGTYGFQVSGAWSTGTGSGGPQFIGCSTDRNARSGVFISATGNSPVMFTNLACRRDGSSSLTQYAGFEVSAAGIPVIVAGLQVYPGVNDDGTGNLSPWSAANISGGPTFVAIADALLHGATQGINGAAPYGMASYRNLAVRTGSTSAPSAITLIADSA